MARVEQRNESALTLTPMQQLADAKEPDDDWTGLKDRAERKKRQTRLAVRAHRRRKAAAMQHQAAPPSEAPTLQQICLSENISVTSVAALPTLYPTALSHPITPIPLPPEHLSFSHCLFPLSSDHLIPLIEYNVYRASLTNIYIMSLFNLLRDPACAYVLDSGPPLFPRAAPYSGVPESLLPTELQSTTPHELWIDILPCPVMRDNAIRAVEGGRLNQGELCADLLKGLCGGAKGALGQAAQAAMGQSQEAQEEEARLIVWTTPWEIGGWEATPGFVKKYRYLLRGAENFLSSTNKWREARGDDRLVWEVE